MFSSVFKVCVVVIGIVCNTCKDPLLKKIKYDLLTVEIFSK